MVFRVLLLFSVVLTAHGASVKSIKPLTEAGQSHKVDDEKEDLKPASSSYSHQYTNWGGRYPSGYEVSVTGHGTIEDRSGSNYGEIGGYNNIGYASNPGYSTGYGVYKGYDGYGQRGYEGGIGSTHAINAGYGGGGYGSGAYGGSGYGAGGYGGGYASNSGISGYGGYDGNVDYSGNSYGGNIGYSGAGGYGGKPGYGGNVGSSGSGGYGGYGGYGGNGGLTSYYGYNNPYYQGNNHLGYGYYNKKPGYGNIYNNGITPSLVTGYRGYSR